MRRLFLVGALLCAMLIPASAANAAPTGEYAVFSGCPTENPNLFICLYSKTTSGSVTTGKKTVPIKNPVVLQGGVELTESGETRFYGAKGGNTLSKSPQPVPGGLLGIQAPSWWPSILRNLFNETINNGFTGVQATVELAGPPSAIKVDLNALLSELNDPALTMPVKIKLSNPFLGNNCYIGSNSNPIVWKLTVGTTSPPPPNQPIKGTVGEGTANEKQDILTFKGIRLVDNSFAVPGANGCGGLFSFLVDPFVNDIVGIPSPAGTNAAILEGTLLNGVAASVRASDP
jgi:hypothetical protein